MFVGKETKDVPPLPQDSQQNADTQILMEETSELTFQIGGGHVMSQEQDISNQLSSNVNSSMNLEEVQSEDSRYMTIIHDLLRRLKEDVDRPSIEESRPVPIDEYELIILCRMVIKRFMAESPFLRLSAPVVVFGDMHGQFGDLKALFDCVGWPHVATAAPPTPPPHGQCLFLGDYADRGDRGVEVIATLFCLKVVSPTQIHLLRGNHEDRLISRVYGFYDECHKRFGTNHVWEAIMFAFDHLPFAALINNKFFCAHGGISPDLEDFQQLESIARPVRIPPSGLLCDLVWADSSRRFHGWASSPRGISFTFGRRAARAFCDRFGIEIILRGHQVPKAGYEIHFGGRCMTLFSAPNYTGHYDNDGSALRIDARLGCRLLLFRCRRVPPTVSRSKPACHLECKTHD